jgi:hypothetical protein
MGMMDNVHMLVMPKVGEPSLGQQAMAGVQQETHTLRSHDRKRTLGYVLPGAGALYWRACCISVDP